MPKRLTDEHTWEEIAELFADRIEEGKFLDMKKWNRKDFLSWFSKREKVGLRFDWRMVARAYSIWKDLQEESDHFTLIVGKEGKGKTTLAEQLCSWIAPNMNLDDICFNMQQYIKKLKVISKDYKKNKMDKEDKSVLIDEGGIDLFSRESMMLSNRILGKTFFVQRFLNINVVICIPYYYSVDSLVRKHRIKTLVIIKERGEYKCVVGKGIKIFNKLGDKDRDKDLWIIPIPYQYFWEGTFNKDFTNTISKKEYEKYKFKHIKGFLDDVDMEASTVKMIKVAKLEKEFGLSRETIIRQINDGNIEGRQIGNQWFITKKAYEKLCMG